MRSKEERRRLNKRTRKEILGIVEEKRDELEATVLEQHKAAGIEGFRESVRSNLLEVHPFRQTSAAGRRQSDLRGPDGTASDMPTLTGAAAGALPVRGAAGVWALLDRNDKLKEIRGNQLYFYHRAGERLEARHG